MPEQYAHAEDFTGATGNLSEADQARLEELLAHGSRGCDEESGVVPGHGVAVVSTAYVFEAQGDDILWLRDATGRQYLLRTVQADKIEVDADDDGTYEYAWDFADAWVEGYPLNAVANGGVFTGIRLRSSLSTAPLAEWRGRVRVTGDWGNATGSDEALRVKYCAIAKAHGLSQRLFAGEFVDEALRQASVEARVPHRSYKLPAIA